MNKLNKVMWYKINKNHLKIIRKNYLIQQINQIIIVQSIMHLENEEDIN